jgi:hypothetical protein
MIDIAGTVYDAGIVDQWCTSVIDEFKRTIVA